MDAGHFVSVLCEEQVEIAGAQVGRFEAACRHYEEIRWFRDGLPHLSDLCQTNTATSVNSESALATLKQAECDVAISFGTCWIRDDALSLLPNQRWNLHGGDPQKYRGLDSHLWALYHDDPGSLVTTVHSLAPDLDAGDIIAGSRIDITSVPELHMLRAANTDLAVQLVKGSLGHLEAVGTVPCMPQATVGRYYSALPGSLWVRCARNYATAVDLPTGRRW